MTIEEAKAICKRFHQPSNPSNEDSIVYTEALNYLARETENPDMMVELGSYYYEQRDFSLALKYYEMAAEKNNLYAIANLGYIWYYGRTGTKDYEKAFMYFNRAMQMGDMVAAYKVADMYKKGYYADKNPERYREIIENLYLQVKNAKYLNDPVPEVLTRLARIRVWD